MSTEVVIPTNQLLRWLDKHPVNKLTRCKTFVGLPAFSIDVTWQGYSDIVGAYNFEGPNNFSLKLDYEAPLNPNYLLCIMWIDENNNVMRYKMWESVGEVIYFDVPLYNGELIGKNFRWEIWSVEDQAVASNAEEINFFTSVLCDYDYRFGNDSELVENDGLVTEFSVQGGVGQVAITTDSEEPTTDSEMTIDTPTQESSGNVFSLPLVWPQGSYPEQNEI